MKEYNGEFGVIMPTPRHEIEETRRKWLEEGSGDLGKLYSE